MTRKERERVAGHVAPGRCTCCGHRLISWSPVKIVEAAQAFVAEHDRLPTARDWSSGTPDHPAQSTVCNAFGSWNGMLAAAGLAERAAWEKPPVWTREMVVPLLLDFRVREGRWPVYRDWVKPKTDGRRSMARPSAWTVAKLFGSWVEALRFAAGTSDPSLKSGTAADPFERTCSGCGTHADNRTAGCKQCNWRHWNRDVRREDSERAERLRARDRERGRRRYAEKLVGVAAPSPVETSPVSGASVGDARGRGHEILGNEKNLEEAA